VREVLVETYAAISAAVRDRSEAELGRPTRTAWTVAELLWHQSQDAVRALTAFATTVEREPDVDAATYWAPFRPDLREDEAAHAAHARRAAAAYPRRVGVVAYWSEVGPAAARAALAADPASRVATQGHVIAVPEFVSTLDVEATVHLLDLTAELEDPLAPPAAALTETRRVLEAIQGGPLPAHWGDTEAVLRATGRLEGWPVLLG
jgi:hypothetical protein